MGWVGVWVWVAIYKNWKILIWKRFSKLWEWNFWFPWWHLELWETREDCAKRETMEEAWIEISNCTLLWVTNDVFNKEKHYITIFIKAEYKSGEVQTMEPEKCEYREWVETDSLPTPLFLPIVNLLNQWQKL